MREDAIPHGLRYVTIDCRLCPEDVASLDARVRARAAESEALEAYFNRPAANHVHLALTRSYADLPLGKTFEMVFSPRPPYDFEPTTAVLRHAVYVSTVVEGLTQARRHVAVFEFPHGVPEMVARMPECKRKPADFDTLALCNRENWESVRKHLEKLSGS